MLDVAFDAAAREGKPALARLLWVLGVVAKEGELDWLEERHGPLARAEAYLRRKKEAALDRSTLPAGPSDQGHHLLYSSNEYAGFWRVVTGP